MILVTVLVLCLACGVLFAYIAAWLTTKRGNTISDVLNAKQLSSETIRVEILDKVKITSNLPIVALYLVAFAVAIGLPAFVSWQLMRDVTFITLSGVIDRAPDRTLCVMPKDMQIETSGSFAIPIMYSSGLQTINFEGENYLPVTMRISVNKLRNSLSVEISNAERSVPKEVVFNPESRTARLEAPIPLALVTGPSITAVPNATSRAPQVSADFGAVGSPPGIGR